MTFEDVISIAKDLFELLKTIFSYFWNVPVLKILFIILIISLVYTKLRYSRLTHKIKNYIKRKVKNKKPKRNENINQYEFEPKEEIEIKEAETYMPYEKANLLTQNELKFFKKLKPICDKNNIQINTKIRLADLVNVQDFIAGYEKYNYFNQIKAKHIDFVLCNPENLEPIALIELDDKSHQRYDRIKSDTFKNELFKKTGYELIRVYQSDDIESILKEKGIIKL